MKTVKLSSVFGDLLMAAAGVYVFGSILWAFFGPADVAPFYLATAMALGTVAKGAEKLAKAPKGAPFICHEAKTKTGKDCFAVSFERNERGETAKEQINLLCFHASGRGMLSFPSQNPDKERFTTYLVWPSQYPLVQNYEKATVKDATKIRDTRKAERDAEKAAKKAAKGEGKAQINAVTAKIQAIKDMVTAGILTEEAGKDALGKLFLS